MMNDGFVAITANEVITCHGDTEQFTQNYLVGITLQQNQRSLRFFEKEYTQQTYPLPVFDTSMIPSRLKRRMSLLSQMIISCSLKCLSQIHLTKEDTGIIVGTGWGELTTTQDLLLALTENNPELSPTQFHNSVHNTAAGYLGIISQITGPTLTISQENQTFEAVLEAAILLIQSETVATAIATVGDIHFNFSVLDANKKNYPQVFAAGSTSFVLQQNEPERSVGYIKHIKTEKFSARTDLYTAIAGKLNQIFLEYSPELIWLSGLEEKTEMEILLRDVSSKQEILFSYSLAPPTYPTASGEEVTKILLMMNTGILSSQVSWFVFDEQKQIQQSSTSSRSINCALYLKISESNDVHIFILRRARTHGRTRTDTDKHGHTDEEGGEST